MRIRGLIILGIAAVVLPFAACDDDDDTPGTTEPPVDSTQAIIADIQEWMPTSLHATAAGMRDWYNQPDGYGAMIGVDYETLGCGGCHVPATGDESCAACHTDVQAAADGTEEMDYATTCLDACHGRQKSEVGMGMPDVHREAGMGCGDCHTVQEIHGDGNPDQTMFDEGVFDVSCADCHVEGGSAPEPPAIRAHSVHQGGVSCDACHMTGSVSCYNCHFAEEVNNHRKVAAAKFNDWIFLGNYEGQVRPINFQSVEYEGKTFMAWGPFHGHSITDQARDCNDCHGSSNVFDYVQNGELDVVTWDEETKSWSHRSGIIPLPGDYESALSFDFVTKDANGEWTFLETGPDAMQRRFWTPLRQDQIDALAHGQ